MIESPALILAYDDSRLDVGELWWPGYQRESLAIGGDWRASTTFAVPFSQGEKWLDYLGWKFEERWGGQLAFAGRVQAVSVNLRGSLILATLDGVWNAVRARYKSLSTAESDELIINGGLETLDPTAEYTFEGWGDLGTDGSVARTSATKHSGTYSAAITAGASTNKQIGTTVRVREGKTYDWTFWTRGDGSNAGRYEIRNINGDTSLVALTSTGVTGTTWTQRTVQFTAPADCSSVSIRLRCPAAVGGVAYFDAVSVKGYEPTEFVTAWYTDAASVKRHGRREREVNSRVITNTTGAQSLAQAVLARYAWPSNEQQELTGGLSSGMDAQVTVTIQGHMQALKHEHYDNKSETLVNASVAIADTLSASPSGVVVAGDIRANTVQVAETSDGESIYNRLVQIAEFGDGAEQYLVGCYAGNRLDYKPIDRNTISYFSEIGNDGRLTYFDAGNRPVVGALLRPGLIVWRRDLKPGVPRRTPFTNDVRATLIGSVRLMRGGEIRIEAMDLNETAWLQAFINSIKQ